MRPVQPIDNILVTIPLTVEQRQALEAEAPGSTFTYSSRETLTSIQVTSADIILGHFSRSEQLENIVDRSTGYRTTQVANALSDHQPDAKSGASS